MKDAADTKTVDLPLDAKRPVGRPPKTGKAMTDAERAAAYRERKAARLAELRDPVQPVSSAIIDLSALPAWRKK